MTAAELVRSFMDLYQADPWSKPLHLLHGCHLVDSGCSVSDAAKTVRTTPKKLEQVLSTRDRFKEILGLALPSRPDQLGNWNRTVGILGQLLLGHAAERVFENMFRSQMPNRELQLKDVREGHSDTDYRLVNGENRAVYRLNIKFHGSRFRRALELVGLDPEDSFALATYKIIGALKKQEEEQLPYFFAIVGVSNLTGQAVGFQLPHNLLETVTYLSAAPKMQGKRDLEDRLIEYVSSKNLVPYSDVMNSLHKAQWYILSARRADKLLRERLFDRVYALRIRNFSRAFRGAEIDMHYSLSQDLIPIEHFFQTVRDFGLHKITTMLERGDF